LILAIKTSALVTFISLRTSSSFSPASADGQLESENWYMTSSAEIRIKRFLKLKVFLKINLNS
jgi:hypothetical protein